MTVKDYYQDAIREIIAERGLEPLASHPTPLVSSSAEFDEVLLHTDSYVHTGDDVAHYRYNRYFEMLGYLRASQGREAHVDIGCGAGLFSWTFLDWASEQGVGRDHLELYGYDHSMAMIRLAQIVRNKLMRDIPDYPELRYSDDVDSLLAQLTANHRKDTGYTITFGHVLVQAHAPRDIQNYTRIISHICELVNDRNNCILVAVDARAAGDEFLEAWNLLLASLESNGISSKQLDVQHTPINDGNRAKLAELLPE